MKVPGCKLAIASSVLFCSTFLVPLGSAQTLSKPAVPAKSKALLKAEADLRAMTAERDQLRTELDALNQSVKSTQIAMEQLKKDNEALNVTSAYRVGLLVILDKEIRGLPLSDLDKQVLASGATDSVSLNIAVDIEKNVDQGIGIIKELVTKSNALVEKYNNLLGIAQSMQAQLNYANSRQQRFQNALALYSAMPKYTPPQAINVQVTNCNLLPALCTH